MKITDPKVMQSGERAFFNAVKEHLDWNAIREVVTKKMKQCSIESKGGELIFHENNVAFKINLHCAMDVAITVDRNGNLISDEDPLVDFSITEQQPAAAPETPMTPISSENIKKKQKAEISDKPAPGIEKSDEKDDFADDDAGVLELDDLLDEFHPDQGATASPAKKDGTSRDDEDMDLETLFFKDKSDEDEEDDDFDTLADEDTAFWEDKK